MRSESGLVRLPLVAPGSYRFHVSAAGFKPREIGVRAKLPWTEDRIRKLFPDLVGETTAQVRLEPDE